MPKRVYISGAMTGVENYKDAFCEAEEYLLSKGYKVINPAYNDDVMPNAEYEEYMALDMFLLNLCDGIYMLKGWENHVAQTENMVTHWQKARKFCLSNLLKIRT